jgi:hypothetical protein
MYTECIHWEVLQFFVVKEKSLVVDVAFFVLELLRRGCGSLRFILLLLLLLEYCHVTFFAVFEVVLVCVAVISEVKGRVR